MKKRPTGGEEPAVQLRRKSIPPGSRNTKLWGRRTWHGQNTGEARPSAYDEREGQR